MQGDLELEREILIKGGHVVCTDGKFFKWFLFSFFFFFWKYQFLRIFLLDRFSRYLRVRILSIDSIRLMSVRSDKTILPTQFSFLLVIVMVIFDSNRDSQYILSHNVND